MQKRTVMAIWIALPSLILMLYVSSTSLGNEKRYGIRRGDDLIWSTGEQESQDRLQDMQVRLLCAVNPASPCSPEFQGATRQM
jgi:hypothetical protein